jgi:hypothetical protein
MKIYTSIWILQISRKKIHEPKVLRLPNVWENPKVWISKSIENLLPSLWLFILCDFPLWFSPRFLLQSTYPPLIHCYKQCCCTLNVYFTFWNASTELVELVGTVVLPHHGDVHILQPVRQGASLVS